MLNISINSNNGGSTFSDVTLSFIMQNAQAQTEQPNDATCLVAEVIVQNRAKQKGKQCWRDITGEDLYEGDVTTCLTTQTITDCQPLRCDTSTKGCYVK